MQSQSVKVKSFWFSTVVFPFALYVLSFSGGCATQTENPSTNSLWFKSAKADLANFPGRFIEDSRDTFFRGDNLTALLLAGGASIAMHNSDADDDIQDNVRRHRQFGDCADKTFDIMGQPGIHFAATGLWYALSAENQDDFNRNRAFTMITALSINGLTTVGLKAIRDNENPNGNRWAWPSGHTSSSFTVASVLDEFYGPKVGIPAYALASLVAYRMVDTGEHWTSDVVFGAALGWVVGHTVAGKHKKLEIGGFQVVPLTEAANASAMGLRLVKRF